ncbi:MAG: hypothetical protein ACO1TE_08305 [Prosthecobacter sp.]
MHEHDDTGDKLEHAYFCYLADKFEREPELLTKPLATIQRWLSIDHHGAQQLLHWQQLVSGAIQSRSGLDALCDVLRADDEETRFLKGFAPFPGLLSREEKKQFLCASRH